jgi:parallel beta-helix repeat protein
MKTLALISIAAVTFIWSCTGSTREPVVWKSIEKDLQTKFILASDGEVIELPEGNYMFTKTLSMDGKKNVTIRGKGMDKTILSWKNQTEGAEGLRISNGTNIVLEDFSVQDAKGDNLKVNDTNGIVMSRIRSVWADGPKTENGAYALYPVLCRNVIIEECIAMGSSDAGIYVGQSDSVIIRNNKAYWNVAGIESENSKWVEIYGNEAYENTGGILVFDLPGLTTYGHTTKVYNNIVRSNNHENFAQKGNIVASIPPGSGMMILATNTIDVYDNEFINNRSVGISIVSYELVAAMNEGEQEQEGSIGGVQTVDNRFREDSLYNPFPYNVKIRGNRFQNKHWFPTFQSDIGKLLIMKSFMSPPDIIYDGIADPDRPERNICIGDNGKITFMNLDAANDFKGLTKDVEAFSCQ